MSLGAECVRMHKGFYCRFATKEVQELLKHKAIVYDNNYIKSRLKEKVNRDVHLEGLLDIYFKKMSLDV